MELLAVFRLAMSETGRMFKLVEEDESLPALTPRTTVYVVIHAESEGYFDDRITERGKKQVEELIRSRVITSASAVYSSPSETAQATADALAAEYGVPVKVEEELSEVSLGNALRKKDRLGNELLNMWNDFDYSPPGGESLEEARHRVAVAANKIASWHEADSIVIVTHPLLGVLFMSRVTGGTPTVEDWLGLGHAPSAILEHERTGWMLVAPFDNTFLSEPTVVADSLPKDVLKTLGW